MKLKKGMMVSLAGDKLTLLGDVEFTTEAFHSEMEYRERLEMTGNLKFYVEDTPPDDIRIEGAIFTGPQSSILMESASPIEISEPPPIEPVVEEPEKFEVVELAEDAPAVEAEPPIVKKKKKVKKVESKPAAPEVKKVVKVVKKSPKKG